MRQRRQQYTSRRGRSTKSIPEPKDFGRALVKSMQEFLGMLESGEPVKATRVERFDTPDGPMHTHTEVEL